MVNSQNHRRDLQLLFRESNKKRYCYCLRGGVEIADYFGSWDHIALELPANSNHICDGNYLLNYIKHRKSTALVKHPNKKSGVPASSGLNISLEYLTRTSTSVSKTDNNSGDHDSQFHHFESVKEHIKHYRRTKPNSLYVPEPQGARNEEMSEEELEDV